MPAGRRRNIYEELCLLVVILIACAGMTRAGDDYPLGPDSHRQPGVPHGTVTHYTWASKIFPGTVRDYWVYVPPSMSRKNPRA